MQITIKEDGIPRIIRDNGIYFQTIEDMTYDDFLIEKEKLVVPFALIQSPLFRIRIICTGHDAWLFYDFHHLIFDGTSVKVFVDEINKAYDGKIIPVEELDIFHLNVIEEKSRASKDYADARKWFADAFKDSPKETIPKADIPMGEEQLEPTFQQIRCRMNIPERAVLSAFCQRKNITLNVLFMASGAYLTGHYCGLDEALVAASYHGRTEQRMNRTFGFLAKPREMRLGWNVEMRTDEYLRLAKNHIMANMIYDTYPITKLQEEFGISQNVILFMYEGDVEVKNPILGGEKAETTELLSNLSASPICYYIYDNPDGSFDVLSVYMSNMYSEQFIRKTIGDYEQAIVQITTASKLNEITFGNDTTEKL